MDEKVAPHTSNLKTQPRIEWDAKLRTESNVSTPTGIIASTKWWSGPLEWEASFLLVLEYLSLHFDASLDMNSFLFGLVTQFGPEAFWTQLGLDSPSGWLGLTVRLVLSPFETWFKNRRERSANSPLPGFWSSLLPNPICWVQTLLDTRRITAKSSPGGSITAGRGSHGDLWWHTYLASARLIKH